MAGINSDNYRSAEADVNHSPMKNAVAKIVSPPVKVGRIDRPAKRTGQMAQRQLPIDKPRTINASKGWVYRASLPANNSKFYATEIIADRMLKQYKSPRGTTAAEIPIP